ncbi:hypothetical protein P3G55_12085 [Leptospira sp. 96542]|nr:hypothetical protein [Leptospira sp. 96542]
MIFKYDIDLFRKKLRIRSLTIVILFFIFVIYNSIQIPSDERIRFFLIFTPVLAVFFLFLFKNYKKQLDLLSGGRVEVEGGMLKQYDSNGNCATLRVRDIEKIFIDKYRGYDRVIFETKEKIHPLINISDKDKLVKLIESQTKVKSEVDLVDNRLFNLKSLIYLSPGILVFILSYIQQIRISYPIFTPEFAGLAFNLNLIIYLLYLPDKESYSLNNFTLKRRLVFISLVIFFFQIYYQLDKAGIFR